MSAIAAAIVGGSIITGKLAGDAASRGAETAAAAQTEASRLGIEEQRRQFDALQELLAPFVKAGEGSLEAQQALLGLLGPEEQRQAIQALEGSPQFTALLEQGENAILQNASATGGLRGGNVQGALAQFRPRLLSDVIQQQFQNLGGLTQLGQASAAGVGAAGLQTGQSISQLLGESGAARAGAALAAGQSQANMWSGIGQTATTLGTLKLVGAF